MHQPGLSDVRGYTGVGLRLRVFAFCSAFDLVVGPAYQESMLMPAGRNCHPATVRGWRRRFCLLLRVTSLPCLSQFSAQDQRLDQLPVFSANNPPLHDHETGQKSLPGAGLRADVGG